MLHCINASAGRDTPCYKAPAGLCQAHGDAAGSGGHRRGKIPSWSPDSGQQGPSLGLTPHGSAALVPPCSHCCPTLPGAPSRLKSLGRPSKDPPSVAQPNRPPGHPHTHGAELCGKAGESQHPPSSRGLSPLRFGDSKDLTCEETPARPPPLGFYTSPRQEHLFRDKSRGILVFSTS